MNVPAWRGALNTGVRSFCLGAAGLTWALLVGVKGNRVSTSAYLPRGRSRALTLRWFQKLPIPSSSRSFKWARVKAGSL